MADDIKSRSKSLSYWLRHKPEAGGLSLDPNGWAETGEVLKALERRSLPTDAALLLQVVNENDKKRFELSQDGARIRARQGHSVAVQGSWEVASPPDQLFHGTVEKFMAAIESEGLSAQNRHHVHLSADLETARKVGQRRGKPIILLIEAQRMATDGFEFALSSNGVWLVERVPPEYLTRLSG